MTLHLDAESLALIARNGAGFLIDGEKFTAQELATIARNLDANSVMRVTGAQRFTVQELATIGRNGPGKVFFE